MKENQGKHKSYGINWKTNWLLDWRRTEAVSFSISVRLCEDRLSLLDECLASRSTAYRHSSLLQHLAGLLRVCGDDTRARQAKVLTLVAQAALKVSFWVWICRFRNRSFVGQHFTFRATQKQGQHTLLSIYFKKITPFFRIWPGGLSQQDYYLHVVVAGGKQTWNILILLSYLGTVCCWGNWGGVMGLLWVWQCSVMRDRGVVGVGWCEEVLGERKVRVLCAWWGLSHVRWSLMHRWIAIEGTQVEVTHSWRDVMFW